MHLPVRQARHSLHAEQHPRSVLRRAPALLGLLICASWVFPAVALPRDEEATARPASSPVALHARPLCGGVPATIYVDEDGFVVGGPLNGIRYAGELHGTRGMDVVAGTDQDDVIVAYAGDDIVCGFGGNDWINGGLGDDRLLGGPGDDRLQGYLGDDILVGGPGSDAVDSEPTLTGG